MDSNLSDAELDAQIAAEEARAKVRFKTPGVQKEYGGVDPLIQKTIQNAPYPLTVTSGAREPQVNAAVGGVPHSAHLDGEGIDLRKDNNSAETMRYLQSNGLKVLDEGDHLHAQKTLSDQDLDAQIAAEESKIKLKQKNPQEQQKPQSFGEFLHNALDSGVTEQKKDFNQGPGLVNTAKGFLGGNLKAIPGTDSVGAAIQTLGIDPSLRAIGKVIPGVENYAQTKGTDSANPLDVLKTIGSNFVENKAKYAKAREGLSSKSALGDFLGGIIPSIVEYEAGMKGLGGPASAIESSAAPIKSALMDMLKGGAAATAVGQAQRGTEFKPGAMTLDALLGMAGPVVEKGLSGVGNYMSEKAPSIINKMLRVTPKEIGAGKNLGSELVNRGITGTQEGLTNQAEAGLSQNEDALQRVLENVKTPINKNTVLNEITNLRDQQIGTNGLPKQGREADVAHLNNVIENTKKNLGISQGFDPASGAPLPDQPILAPEANIRKRDIYQNVGGKGYLKDNPTIALEGQKAVARGYRKAIEEVAPEASKYNQELSFFGQLGKKMENLNNAESAGKSSGNPMARLARDAVGGAVGTLFGGPVGGAGGVMAAETAAKAAQTPLGTTLIAKGLNKGGNLATKAAKVATALKPVITAAGITGLNQ